MTHTTHYVRSKDDTFTMKIDLYEPHGRSVIGLVAGGEGDGYHPLVPEPKSSIVRVFTKGIQEKEFAFGEYKPYVYKP